MKTCIKLLFVIILVALHSSYAQIPPHPLPATQALVMKDFSNRVNAYIKVRKNVEDSFTSLKSSKDSGKIAAHKIELAGMIIAERPDAHQSDMFTPEIAVQLSTRHPIHPFQSLLLWR